MEGNMDKFQADMLALMDKLEPDMFAIVDFALQNMIFGVESEENKVEIREPSEATLAAEEVEETEATEVEKTNEVLHLQFEDDPQVETKQPKKVI